MHKKKFILFISTILNGFTQSTREATLKYRLYYSIKKQLIKVNTFLDISQLLKPFQKQDKPWQLFGNGFWCLEFSFLDEICSFSVNVGVISNIRIFTRTVHWSTGHKPSLSRQRLGSPMHWMAPVISQVPSSRSRPLSFEDVQEREKWKSSLLVVAHDSRC